MHVLHFFSFNEIGNESTDGYLMEDVPYNIPGAIMPDGYVVPAGEEIIVCPGDGSKCYIDITLENGDRVKGTGYYDSVKYPDKYTVVNI